VIERAIAASDFVNSFAIAVNVSRPGKNRTRRAIQRRKPAGDGGVLIAGGRGSSCRVEGTSRLQPVRRTFNWPLAVYLWRSSSSRLQKGVDHRACRNYMLFRETFYRLISGRGHLLSTAGEIPRLSVQSQLRPVVCPVSRSGHSRSACCCGTGERPGRLLWALALLPRGGSRRRRLRQRSTHRRRVMLGRRAPRTT